MKLVKTSNWIRLRGQLAANNEICKIDTAVFDKERVFFVPETDDERTFFSIDSALAITSIPCGPTTHNPDESWGWRFFADKTEDDMKNFTYSIKQYIERMLDNALEQGLTRPSNRILN